MEENGIWTLLRTRLLSFGLVLGLGFLLLVSLLVGAAIAAFGKWWNGFFDGWEALLHALNFSISFAITTLLFAMIYKLMPRARIAWRDVCVGAAVTALLFEVGKFLIGLYLGKTSVASSFGAAGSLVVLLVWVYFSAQIFLLGAEFTWVYSHKYGSNAGKPGYESAPTGQSGSGRVAIAVDAKSSALRDHAAMS
jgi:membrane protein